MDIRSQKTGGLAATTPSGAPQLLDWTGERYLPWLEEAAIGYEHLHRYAYATQFVQNKRVLDLACGEGYGSYLLARTAESVVGIDIDEDAIRHARNKYLKQNLEFKVGSITEVPIVGEHCFDVAVCYEALEHIEDHHKLLGEVKRLLTPDGIFIVSTPNKTVYTDEPQYTNPFHVHELYFDEFRELFEKHFKNVKFLGQRIYCNSNIWPVFCDGDSKTVEYVIDRNPREFVFVENDKRTPLYFIAIASDADSDVKETGSALVDVSDALLRQKDKQIATHVTEQERLLREIGQLSNAVQGQQKSLAEKEEHADRLVQNVSELQSVIGGQQKSLAEKEEHADRLVQNVTVLQSVIEAQQQALAQKDQQFAQKEKEVTQLVAEGERLCQETSQLQANLQSREQYIRAIEDSLAWMMVVKYKKIREKLCPDGTRRRKIYNSVKDSFKSVARERVPAPQPNNTDSFWSLKNGQTISLPENLQQSAAHQTSATRSIFARPERAILAKLSVVIPTKNGMSEGFESTLRGISKQIGIAETEVIVVDSGSSDGTVEVAKSYGAKVFSISPEEFNHGATRNYAAEKTTGEFLLFTVQDAIPATEDLFYKMAKALLADPKLAGVSVRQVPKSDADIYACWEMWNHYKFLFEAPPPKLSNPDEIDKLSSQQLRRLAGLDDVCSMVRRELWEKNRFKPTPFGEDLEFGLSCVRQGYSIGLLPQQGVIHSHTRSPFYTLSRHYVDMLVLLKLFEKDFQPSWVEAVNHDQLFSSLKATYLAIGEFAGRLDNHFARNPALVLKELLSFVAAGRGTVQKPCDHGGEPTLNKFFGRLDTVFEEDYSTINPCKLAFEGTINSILQFLADRYPVILTTEMIAVVYKAFAGVAGSILGEYCFWLSQHGIKATQMQVLDNVLREMQA